MTKLRYFARFSDDDYPGAPAWFLDFIGTLNPMIDELNPLLSGNIELSNNIQCERQTVTLSHGVPVLIRLQRLKVTPFLVRVGYANGFVGSGAITGYLNDGTFYVTVFFQGAPPTSPVATLLVFEA